MAKLNKKFFKIKEIKSKDKNQIQLKITLKRRYTKALKRVVKTTVKLIKAIDYLGDDMPEFEIEYENGEIKLNYNGEDSQNDRKDL